MQHLHGSSSAVDPPKDIRVLDPGHLGYLEITWNPPSISINVECTVMYQLDYFNTYKDRWEVSAYVDSDLR